MQNQVQLFHSDLVISRQDGHKNQSIGSADSPYIFKETEALIKPHRFAKVIG